MARAALASDVARADFDAVRALLEGARRKTRPRKHDVYDVFCAILYLLEGGGSWRSLPPDLPPWRTVHEYFTQWTEQRQAGPTLLERALALAGRERALDQLRAQLARRSGSGHGAAP
ncbi:MAG: transposase [Pseudomonadota bacterium]